MMASAALYLLKVSVFVLAFYIPFIAILKRTTFFHLNRAYLVVGLLLSFALPFYKVLTPVSPGTPLSLPFVEPILEETEIIISKASESPSSFNVYAVLFIIYLAGIAVRVIALARSISSTLTLKRKSEFFLFHGVKVYKGNSPVPFSFFNCVFLPHTLNDDGVLVHEAAHVRQRHWIDLIVLEIVSIILWFNPVMIFFKRSLKQQHEYLADRAAIQSGIDEVDYLSVIQRQVEFVTLSPITSQFYFSSIKNRINMLTKKRTSRYALFMYGIALPLIVCLTMAFSSPQPVHVLAASDNDSTQEKSVLGLPIDKKNVYTFESGYGKRRHPVFGVVRFHTGIDLKANEGVPVVSSQDGVVLKATLDGDWGNIIIIQHDDTYTTYYAHLKVMNVKVGDRVEKGQEIGLVGHTGVSTQDHLHFELHKNGKAIDPLAYLPEVK